MATIINKSNHPVEVKKIHLNIWSLRDEIEAAITIALNATDEEKKDVEQIKAFYSVDGEKPQLDRVIPEKKTVPAELILADINMQEVFFFSQLPFKIGQTIGLQLDIPKKFILSAQVTHCSQLNRNSRVIKVDERGYRLSAKFLFSFDKEEENLRDFLKSIEPVIPPKLQNIKESKASDDDDDDFEDLGF